MSRLGDLIVELGPFIWDQRQSQAMPDITGDIGDAELNGLRDELIELRAAANAKVDPWCPRCGPVTPREQAWADAVRQRATNTGSQAACLLAGDGEHDCTDPTAEGTCRYEQGGGPR